LLRKVVEIGLHVGRGKSILVVPIIDNLIAARKDTSKRGGEQSEHKTNGMRRGGEMAMKKIAPKQAQNVGRIKVRFDSRVMCRTPAGDTYVAPANEEIAIIGLYIWPVCSTAAPRARVQQEDYCRGSFSAYVVDKFSDVVA